MKGKLNIIAGIVVAAVAAAPATAGDGGNAAGHYTPQALKALGQQWEAKASFYGKRSISLANDRPAASFYTPQALRALGERGSAMAQFYAQPPGTESGGLDWASAGIGVGAGFGVALLVAAMLIVRPRRLRRLALR
jgi:hypothetical protein